MGGIKFVPDFDNLGTQDQWYDFVGGSGKIQIGVAYQPGSVSPLIFCLPERKILIDTTGSIPEYRRF
jgi:hypothetical protein